MVPMKAKLKISISEDAKAFVESLASKKAVPEAEIFRRALDAYRFLEEVAAKDGEVMLRRANGQIERLVSF
jgi:hypothetical protein